MHRSTVKFVAKRQKVAEGLGDDEDGEFVDDDDVAKDKSIKQVKTKKAKGSKGKQKTKRQAKGKGKGKKC